MTILHLFIVVILIKLSIQFWWGCCGGCSSCGGWAYQPTVSYINYPIYQRIPNQQIEDQPTNPLIILHRKTIIKEVPYEDESEEERPRYMMKARRPKPIYDDRYEEDRYMSQKPVQKVVYLQEPSRNYNGYTTQQTPLYIPSQGGNINVGQSDGVFNQPQQYQQIPSQNPYQQIPSQNSYQQIPPQSSYQQIYQNSPQTMVQSNNQQQYKKKS